MSAVIEEAPIIDNEAAQQFEVEIEGLTGFLQYIRRADYVVYPHTVVPPELEGRGIAGRLSRHALDDARARGLKVVPRCPFVRAFIDHHPEYEDLVQGA
jgi:predicted GNAT family acetyltransferase